MTLHMTMDRADGTELVWEEGQEPLGLIKGLEVGPGVRRAWVAHLPTCQDAVDRTRETLIRHGFDVGTSTT